MEHQDLLVRDIEKMGILIGKLMNFKLLDTHSQLVLDINNGYAELFDLKENEINLKNKIILGFLNSEDKSKLFIKKLECLIQIIESDYIHISTTIEKKNVLFALIKKLISADFKNYYPARFIKMDLYKD